MTPKNLQVTIIFLGLLLCINNTFALSSKIEYAGSEKCASCHKMEYDEWKNSGHASILHKSTDVKISDIPIPEGYSRKDISYVIGGYKWKALFLDRDGYLITSENSQYNIKNKKWVDYLPGQKIPYNCGRCHTTGYSPEGHQKGLKGTIGTWKFEGVQCEACHGPGEEHVNSTLKTDIKVDRNLCSQCHSVKPADTIPLDNIFLAPYTEANQLMKSKMKDLACVDCHNPHLSSGKSIKQSCETCHKKAAAIYKESYMYRVGVKCIDCHMPPAGTVAEGDTKIFHGDLRSHLFKIDHEKEFPSVTKNGYKINPGYLSVDYACIRCHALYENRQWAISFGAVSHRIKTTTNIKIMRLQMVFASIGMIAAILSLISAVSLKKWLWPTQNMKMMLSIHKHSAWITFAVYVFVSSLCIYFHFPISNPSKAIDLGWFLIHPINGTIGLIIYGGKILAVRKYKRGWASQGILWGTVLFIFWLIQYITAILSFFNILKV